MRLAELREVVGSLVEREGLTEELLVEHQSERGATVIELNLRIFLQGDPSLQRKPPVDLDVRLSLILPGQ